VETKVGMGFLRGPYRSNVRTEEGKLARKEIPESSPHRVGNSVGKPHVPRERLEGDVTTQT